MLFWIWLTCITAALVLYFRQVYSRFRLHGVKYSTPIPPLGNMWRTMLRMEHFSEDIQKYYNKFKGERFVGKYEFTIPVILLRDVELIKKITIKDFEHFLDHRSVIDESTDPLFGRVLIALRGQEWKDMRSTLSPAFTSSKIRLMVPFMTEVGDQMVRAIKKKIKMANNAYIDLDAKDLTGRYTNDVIASCAFGLKVDSFTDEDNEFYKMGKAATIFNTKQLIIMFLTIAMPKLMKTLNVTSATAEASKFFRHLVTGTIEDREARHITRPDMIHLLMEARNGNLSHEDKTTDDVDRSFAAVEESVVGKDNVRRIWSDDDLIAQAAIFFIAGFETVSSAMTFLLYELAVNPDVQDKLYQEIRENDVRNGGQFDYNSVQQMTYLDMVVSEILRLWPPAIATDRVCVKDYNLGKVNDKATEDYIIRKGESVHIPLWAIHRDPEFFPDPLKFKPERFSEENKHNINPYCYMPFGIGPRNCIASRFALCELKVMTYQLLQQLEVSPAETTPIPARLCRKSFNARLAGGHTLRFRSR